MAESCLFCGREYSSLGPLLWHVAEEHEYEELDFLPGRWVCWVAHERGADQVRCWCGGSFVWHVGRTPGMHCWDRHLVAAGGLATHLFELALGAWDNGA